MSALLDRYERRAVMLQPAYDRHLALIEQSADRWGGMLAGTQILDMADDMRLPRSARENLRRSRAMRLAGLEQPQMGFGPFRQMIDGSIMLANQTAITGTTETALWPVAQYSGFAANQLRAGQVWAITAMGIITTAGASQGNITHTPRYGTSSGGVSLIAGAATALAASATNAPWQMQYLFVVRSVANAGLNSNAVGGGCFETSIAAIAAATGNTIVMGATANVAIDCSIAAGLYMGITLGSASDTMAAMIVAVESLN